MNSDQLAVWGDQMMARLNKATQCNPPTCTHDEDYAAALGPEPDRSPEDEARIKKLHKELGLDHDDL
jgi:hypothetical protein